MPSRTEIGAFGRHWPVPKRDAIGRKVRTLSDMETKGLFIPRGTILTVDSYKERETGLVGEPCPCCGVTVRIHGVMISSILLLSDEELAEEARKADEKRRSRQPRTMVVPEATTRRRPRDGSAEGL